MWRMQSLSFSMMSDPSSFSYIVRLLVVLFIHGVHREPFCCQSEKNQNALFDVQLDFWMSSRPLWIIDIIHAKLSKTQIFTPIDFDYITLGARLGSFSMQYTRSDRNIMNIQVRLACHSTLQWGTPWKVKSRQVCSSSSIGVAKHLSICSIPASWKKLKHSLPLAIGKIGVQLWVHWSKDPWSSSVSRKGLTFSEGMMSKKY